MGGNAVAAYREDFDLEGGSGMVARGIGTVIRLEASSVSGKPRLCHAWPFSLFRCLPIACVSSFHSKWLCLTMRIYIHKAYFETS